MEATTVKMKVAFSIPYNRNGPFAGQSAMAQYPASLSKGPDRKTRSCPFSKFNAAPHVTRMSKSCHFLERRPTLQTAEGW